ncbi:MAG: hypothetical protein KDB35_20870 [Acidimicrobiales bacterium]|nr:hypothetical protein [Acidimicrobiales bacterium]MCB1249369.1 hypothetical protein [Acidimicrobiales bacterium]MCB1260335.1 hypothetical protein [Acidimicrobiales bacterium]
MTTIEIDYSRYGRSQRITVPLFVRERVVEVGERVRVVGDDVPERTARVTALLDGGRKAVLEFDDRAE